MSNSPRRRSLAQFAQALQLLDTRLQDLNATIEIKAIGGFALLRHNVRKGDRAYTVDIDSVTRDYSAEILRAINDVAEEADLDPDWLNNHNVIDNNPEVVEEMIEANWIKQNTPLKNISVSVADIPTLTRSKLLASVDHEYSGRNQDIPDLLALVDHQGIRSTQSFVGKYPDPWDEHTEIHAMLQEHFAKERASRPTRGIRPPVPLFDDPTPEHDELEL